MLELRNIVWLGLKEIRSVLSDVQMLVLLVWCFGLSIALESQGQGHVNNASIAIVDEDHSALSRRIRSSLRPPHFREPELISAEEINRAMDASEYMFVLVIPPHFERDIARGRRPAVQFNIDATAVQQAGLGSGYVQSIVDQEVAAFFNTDADMPRASAVLRLRRAFNPNAETGWFESVVALIDQVTMLTIILTGAALLREREHGTLAHLLVMPLRAAEIALAKIWANGLIVLVAFALSLTLVVQGALSVPVAGSRLLLVFGTALYVFAAASVGVLLATLARSMAQFAMLVLLVILPMLMLSGGTSPIEAQPEFLQPFTWLLPSRHYTAFAQAIMFRGADLSVTWPELTAITGLGVVYLAAALASFRRSVIAS